jgi:hypothetical protein
VSVTEPISRESANWDSGASFMKTKLFLAKMGYFGREGGFGSRVEREINEWLDAHPTIKIAEIVQSCSGGSFEPMTLVISVWYQENPHQP